MIFEVLARLSVGPRSMAELASASQLKHEYLETVLSEGISSGLIERSGNRLQLTARGARTAIYLLVTNEWTGLSKGDYQAIMTVLNKRIDADIAA